MRNAIRVEGLDINEMDDGFMIYDARTDRVHFLNHTARAVLECCDGALSSLEIARVLEDAWDLESPPFEEEESLLLQLTEEGLIRN